MTINGWCYNAVISPCRTLKKNSPRRPERSIGGNFLRMPTLLQAVSELAKSRKPG
jgi:hypothetical protein